MAEVIGVRFKSTGKVYYFDPGEEKLEKGEMAIVETARGIECGEVAMENREVKDSAIVQPLRRLIRRATPQDLKQVEENHKKEKSAFKACERRIASRGLEMKLVEVEYTFDNSKILFYFTADGRVDFRELVKDLASVFRTRIELRQIGVRDEAKMLGGLGICGRPLCCSQFLDEFIPVSIKMAKTQNLSLNPTKISGTCGRLMCCLKYEQEADEDLVKHAPKQESFVETPDGAGTVSSVNLLRQTVQVRLDSAPETPKCYHNCELCVIRSGKGKRPEGYVEPPLSELAKLRRPPEGEEDRPAGEEDALSAALEAAFPSRRSEEEPREGRRSDRRRGNSRRSQPRSEEGEGTPQKSQESAHSGGRNHRRRRHSKGGSGKTQE